METRNRTKRVQVRLPDYLKAEVKRIAEEKQQAEGTVVVDLVETALQLNPSDLTRRLRALELEMEKTLQRLEVVEKRAEGRDKVLDALSATFQGRREDFTLDDFAANTSREDVEVLSKIAAGEYGGKDED